MSAEIIQFPMRGAASGSRLHDEYKRGMRAYAQMINECCEEVGCKYSGLAALLVIRTTDHAPEL